MLKKENMVFYLSLIFLYILPFLDGGTSFMAQILIFLAPLVLLAIGLVTKNFNFNNLSKKGLVFFSLFLITALISTFFSQSKLFSIPEFFRQLSYFLFFVIFLFTAKKENQKPILIFLFLTAVGLCTLSLWYLLPQTTKPISGMNLIYANYGHSHLADFLLLVLPFLFSFVLISQNKKQKLWGIILLGFFLFAFAFTFSRAGFLVLLLTTGFLFWLIRPKEKKAKKIFRLTALVPVLLLILIFSFSFNFKIKQKDELIPMTWIGRQLIKPDFDANRIEYWHQAWLGFKERPFLGFGPGTFELIALKFQSKPSSWSNFAHNFFLQLLAEAGLFGFLSFCYFLIFCLKKIWLLAKKNKANFFITGGLGAILASTLHSFWDYDWHFPAIFLLFLLILANLLVFSQTKEVSISKINPKILFSLLLLLSFLSFGFGLSRIVGEYFLQKKDYQKALAITFWPPSQVREIGDKIFSEDFLAGEKTGQKLIKLSFFDPSINYWLGDKYYFKGETSKAAGYYQKAIENNPLGNYFLYPRLALIFQDFDKFTETKETYRAFSLIYSKGFFQDNSWAGKQAYLLCHQFYQAGKIDQALSWCTLARKTLPQWSFFYLEEAALLGSLDQKDKIQELLTECLNYPWPADHCREFLNSQKENFGLESFGYWQKEIEKIPD